MHGFLIFYLSPYLSALDFWNSTVWWTWYLVYFKLGYWLQQAEKSSLNWEKIQFIKLRPNQTEYFKLENCKNQVQIDRYLSLFLHLNNGVKGFLKEHYNFHSSIFSKYFLGNICIIIITQSSCEKVHAKKENKKDFQKINEIIVPSRGQEATSLSFKKGCIKVKVGVSL